MNNPGGRHNRRVSRAGSVAGQTGGIDRNPDYYEKTESQTVCQLHAGTYQLGT
jgi:hypothetical protein